MRAAGRTLGAALLGVGLWGCAPAAETVASAEAARPPTVNGTVTYRERIALPPDAVVRVRLVALGDPSVPLAEQAFEGDGRQVPIPFSLPLADVALDAARRYAVRAEVRGANGTLLWAADEGVPVLTQGAPAGGVEVVLRRATDAHGMPPLPTGRTLLYGCDTPDGDAFTFTVRPGPGEVGLALPERFGSTDLVLPQVWAASGSKFEGDGVVFWVSGTSVRVEVDGVVYPGCAERPE